MNGKRNFPPNRRISPSYEAGTGEMEPVSTSCRPSKKVTSARKKRGPARVRRALSTLRTGLQGLRAAASITFVVVASIALAWGIKQHVVSSPRFAIKNIRVEGTAKRTPEQVAETAGLTIGMNIFTVDLVNASRRLLQDPWIADAEVERKLPSTVTVSIVEREVAAVVAVDADLYLCTHEGELFKKLEADDPVGLVVISGLTAGVVAGDQKLATQRVKNALELLANYERQGPARQHPVQEIHIADDGALRMIVGTDAVTLEMGNAPYRKKILRAGRVLGEVRRRDAEPSIVFLDNDAHPERVVVRMR